MPRIIQYRSKCIGCGLCVELQPEYWRMSRKDGKATLLHSTFKGAVSQLHVPRIPEGTPEVVKACPVRIIQVH